MSKVTLTHANMFLRHWHVQYIFTRPLTQVMEEEEKKGKPSPIPYQQRTLLFVPFLSGFFFFWSNIRCEVEESALRWRGDGAQGSRQGAADE